MALPVYLAMTAAEMELCDKIPEQVAYMACHFSSYGLGLSNLPASLPPESILILNDRTPVRDHDPQLICRQLSALAEEFSLGGILLDFQRPGDPQAAAIVKAVTQAPVCPIAATEYYAQETNCAVFLETPRAYHPLQSRVDLWKNRELWLELSLSPGTVTVTKDGSCYHCQTDFPEDFHNLHDPKLFCHYGIQKGTEEVVFSFRRTAEDLRDLLDHAQTLGVCKAIGLYQELGE